MTTDDLARFAERAARGPAIRSACGTLAEFPWRNPKDMYNHARFAPPPAEQPVDTDVARRRHARTDALWAAGDALARLHEELLAHDGATTQSWWATAFQQALEIYQQNLSKVMEG